MVPESSVLSRLGVTASETPSRVLWSHDLDLLTILEVAIGIDNILLARDGQGVCIPDEQFSEKLRGMLSLLFGVKEGLESRPVRDDPTGTAILARVFGLNKEPGHRREEIVPMLEVVIASIESVLQDLSRCDDQVLIDLRIFFLALINSSRDVNLWLYRGCGRGFH